MAQTDFRGLRHWGNDTITQIFIQLQKKYIRHLIEQQVSEIDDADNEDIIYVDDPS